jgi:hypothetical protein
MGIRFAVFVSVGLIVKKRLGGSQVSILNNLCRFEHENCRNLICRESGTPDCPEVAAGRSPNQDVFRAVCAAVILRRFLKADALPLVRRNEFAQECTLLSDKPGSVGAAGAGHGSSGVT